MTRSLSRLCRAVGQALVAIPLQVLAASSAPLAGPAETAADGTGFDLGPVLVDGRLPAPNLVLAWQRLPTEPSRRREVLDAVRHAVGRLADGSVRLGWVAGRACGAPSPARPPCARANPPRPLDAARRKAFAAFLQQEAQAAAAASADDVASLVAAATSVLKTTDANTDTCRQSHLLVLGTSVDDGTERSHTTNPAADPASPRVNAIHRVRLAKAGAGQAIDRALRTVLAEAQGLPGWRATSLVSAPAGTEDVELVVAARFDALRWHGELVARTKRGEFIDAQSAPWGRATDSGDAHTTASLLDRRPAQARIILSSRGEAAQLEGIPWRWPDLTPEQRRALADDGHGTADALGERRLAWLRGAREDEQAHGGPLRDRVSRQADALHAQLWATTHPATGSTVAPTTEALIFAGANGGMLHAFAARDGNERFAYVPQGVHGHLAKLTRPDYIHRAFVDASPFSARWDDGDARRHWVFGFPGAGAKGYFAIDVASPSAFDDESRAALQVRLDTTAAADPHLGHIFGAPVTAHGDSGHSASVARLEDGRPALVLGNGYDSRARQAALLIQYLDGARELRKITAGRAGSNGLSPVRLVDLEGDRIADLAYAGDLQGRLWKFDLRSADPAQWAVARAGEPVFAARDAQGQPQPITTAPHWEPHPDGGGMLVVGTGQLLRRADRHTAGAQSIYGIRDHGDGTDAVIERARLQQRSLSTPPAVTAAATNPPAGTGSDRMRGWFIDLPSRGERVLAHPAAFDAGLVDVVATVPAAAAGPDAAESCTPARERRFRYTLRALDGTPPRTALYGDANASAEFGAHRVELPDAPVLIVRGIHTDSRLQFDGTRHARRTRPGFTAVRPAWRQLR